jgi:hypothetical protein
MAALLRNASGEGPGESLDRILKAGLNEGNAGRIENRKG